MKSFSITDVGKKRTINQDFVFCSESEIGRLKNLFIVADGMGGHNAGDFASRYCVECVIDYISTSKEPTNIRVLDGAIQYANEMIRKMAQENSELHGMGTTFVAATIENDVMLVANVGDSRLYLINQDIRQITKDHSLVEAMVENGEIEAREARFHPNKNVITRAVGVSDTVMADYFELDLIDGDLVLLCSDGLSNMLDDQEIFDIIKGLSNDIEEAANVLIKKANEHGGKDNIAIIIMKR